MPWLGYGEATFNPQVGHMGTEMPGGFRPAPAAEKRRAAVIIDYTNHAKERRHRVVLPFGSFFGYSEYHGSDPLFILLAVDPEDGRTKHFAHRGIHSWEDLGYMSEADAKILSEQLQQRQIQVP